MKIRIATGDFKSEEQSLQLPADTVKYSGRDNHSIRDFNKTPHGVPAGGSFYVDNSYDARPINTVDVNASISDSYYWTFDTNNQNYTGVMNVFTPPLPGQDSTQSNVVPLGYVLAIRCVYDFGINIVAGSYTTTKRLFCNGTASVLVNGSGVKGSDMVAGWGSSNELWVLVDEGQTVGIAYNLTVDYAPNGGNGYWYVDVTPVCSLYAHLIQKSGAPLQFTAANAKSTGNKVSVTPGMPK